jgi:1,4-alpha-glucan branching enzyme
MITMKKNGKKVWVTFTFIADEGVSNVSISGEWNNWEEESMKQKKDGSFFITKILKEGDCLEFGYKVNGNEWRIEEDCSCVPTSFGSENSLLQL